MHPSKTIALIILLALVAVFTFQNTAIMEVNFLFWSFGISSSLMILAALFSGIIIGLILSILNVRKKSIKVQGNSDQYQEKKGFREFFKNRFSN